MESIPFMGFASLSKDINAKTYEARQNFDLNLQELLGSDKTMQNHSGPSGEKCHKINRD